MKSWQHPHTRLSFWGFLATCILLRQLPTVQAQENNALGVTTSPSNDTQSLTASSRYRYLLNSTVLQFPSAIQLALLAGPSLTQSQFQQSSIVTNVSVANPANSGAKVSAGVVFVSCDPQSYPGYIGPGATISNVLLSKSRTLQAVILYSTHFDYCNYTWVDPLAASEPIFTVLSASSAQLIRDQVASHPNNTSVNIGPDMSTTNGNPDTSSPNPSGIAASPTTAVAMIILYSITGIITALFLGIIITGAVRAHRNPERYGPRNVVGRPRQSRARGIARAMLETIPIVKFGSEEEQHAEAVKGDVEMASRHDGDGPDTNRSSVLNNANETNANEANENETVPTTEMQSTEPGTENQNQHPEAEAEAPSTSNGSATSLNRDSVIDGGNHVCPICTDDFVKGQDVRVLPCSHQFHPECIDPWLINVSGTCPLCRIDLNPAPEPNAETQENQEEGEASSPQEVPPQEAPTDPAQDERSQAAHHRGFTSYLSDIRRVRNASVEERLAALRRLRQSNEQQEVTGAAEESSEQNQSHRRRLTARFRDRFRIRTRQVEEPVPHSSSPPPPTHAASD